MQPSPPPARANKPLRDSYTNGTEGRSTSAKRLHSLDALRGVGALAIVVWHWQHFYAISGTWQAGWRRTSEPLYFILKPLYDDGWAAVDFFFAVSGFVFFWLYRETIADRKIGAGTFALQRFSRLYPLYFATLIVAAAMQLLFRRITGSFFIFGANDWHHFLASLVLIQQWLPPDELQSFNGPDWAVSIEVLLYLIFFLAVRLGLRGPRSAVVLALAGAPIFLWDGQIGRGVMGFFMGGVTYFAVRSLAAHVRARLHAKAIVVAAIVAWALVVAEIYFGPVQSLMRAAPAPVAHVFATSEYQVFLLAFIFVVVPLTLAALALHEQVLGGAYGRVSFLGDISYSTYLLHFPMQLALALFALRVGLKPQDFQTGYAMLAFYAALIGLGALSHYYFERPLQTLIRGAGRKAALSPAE